MKHLVTFIYPFKVWLFTILTAPFLVMAASGIQNSASLKGVAGVFPIIGLIILSGAVISLPSLLFFWLLFNIIKTTAMHVWVEKLLFGVGGMVFIFLSFYIFTNRLFIPLDTKSFIWSGSYCFSLLLAVFIFKIKK